MPSKSISLNNTNTAKMPSQSYCGEEAPDDIKLATRQSEEDWP